MASRSLTDGTTPCNRTSNSDSQDFFQRPSQKEYLASLEEELSFYHNKLDALISVGYDSDLSASSKEQLHYYFAVLEEQMYGAMYTPKKFSKYVPNFLRKPENRLCWAARKSGFAGA